MVATSTNLQATKNGLSFLPGGLAFDETALPIAPEKEAYLRTMPVFHDAFLHRPNDGLSVEAIDHHADSLTVRGPYQPIVSARSERVIGKASGPLAECAKIALNCHIGLHNIAGIDTPLWTFKGPEKGISVVALACRDLDYNMRFWSDGLGAVVGDSGQAPTPWTKLSFIGISANTCGTLLLVQLPEHVNASSMLDDPGWTCMSVLVRPQQDIAGKLNEYGGIDVGTAYASTIGGKKLLLNFIRSPDGALIELLAPGGN